MTRLSVMGIRGWLKRRHVHFGFDVLFQALGVLWLFDLLGRRQDGTYRRWAQQAPNALCWLRIGVSVVALPLLVQAERAQWPPGWSGWCWSAVVAAFCTDALDGALARRMAKNGQRRSLAAAAWGAFLDPLSDKIAEVLGVIATFLLLWPHRQLLVVWFICTAAAMAMALEADLALTARMEKGVADRYNLQTMAPRALPFGKVKANCYAIAILLALAAVVWAVPVLLPWAAALMVVGLACAYPSHYEHKQHLARLYVAAHTA